MATRKITIQFQRGVQQVTKSFYKNEVLDQREEKKWIKECGGIIERIESYSESIALLSENNAARNNRFNETLTLVKTELEFEKQKLRMLTKSDGVFYEAVLVNNGNKIYEFEEDNNSSFKFIGVRKYQGEWYQNDDRDEIFPVNNIGDLVVAIYKSNEERATDIIGNIGATNFNFKMEGQMRVIMQDIGKEGHVDYTDLSSFVDRRVAKYNNEQGGRAAIYGTVIEFNRVLLNPHGNDPVEKAQFTIQFDNQEHNDIVDVEKLSEYVTNYRRVSRNDPLDGKSRCENPRIKRQRVNL